MDSHSRHPKLSAAVLDPTQLDEGTEQLLRVFFKNGISTHNNDRKLEIVSSDSSVATSPFDYGSLDQNARVPSLSVPATEAQKPVRDGVLFVMFNIRASTCFGEEVFVTGSIKELGEWNPTKAVKLQTNKNNYPMWSTAISIPSCDHTVEYKFLILKDKVHQTFQWEEFDTNRKLELAEVQGIFIHVDDGTFGVKKPPVIITTKTIELLRQEIAASKEVQKQYQEEKRALEKDLDDMKCNLGESEALVTQLKKQITIMEGSKLDTLSTTDLRTLVQKSKKTSHRANVELMKRLENEIYHLQRLKDCAVCMDKPIDTVCLPCGHVRIPTSKGLTGLDGTMQRVFLKTLLPLCDMQFSCAKDTESVHEMRSYTETRAWQKRKCFVRCQE